MKRNKVSGVGVSPLLRARHMYGMVWYGKEFQMSMMMFLDRGVIGFGGLHMNSRCFWGIA